MMCTTTSVSPVRTKGEHPGQREICVLKTFWCLATISCSKLFQSVVVLGKKDRCDVQNYFFVEQFLFGVTDFWICIKADTCGSDVCMSCYMQTWCFVSKNFCLIPNVRQWPHSEPYEGVLDMRAVFLHLCAVSKKFFVGFLSTTRMRVQKEETWPSEEDRIWDCKFES